MPLPDASRKYRYTYSHIPEGTRDWQPTRPLQGERQCELINIDVKKPQRRRRGFFKILPPDVVTINDEIDFCGRASSR
jgi:hypothetical protein